MPTNPNMVAIQTVTIGAGGAATIDFTNIPQTYTDLQLVVSSRATATDTPVKVEFNNVTTGYSWRRIYGSGSAASSLSGTDAYYFWTATSSQTASTFGSGQLYIPNYTSSNNKSISTESLNENNGTAADMFITAALWSNSAAITSIKLTPLTGSFAQYSTATLYGVTSAGTAAKATGGIITMDDNYIYHTFLASGTFTPTQNLTADYLVVAGGGGGSSGGGGAGGLRSTVTATGGGGSLESAVSLTGSTAYTITVGAGGAGGGTGGGRGVTGSNSSISGSGLSTITSNGGGGGGSLIGGQLTGGNGGSGGGGGRDGTYAGGTGTANQGYAGGTGSVGPYGAPGSGGGAGQAGQNGRVATPPATLGMNGGNGVQVAMPTLTYYAGGGAGASNMDPPDTTAIPTGGLGGGGNGAAAGTTNGGNGTANTGGGGGGGDEATGGSGGSGIIVIRYAK